MSSDLERKIEDAVRAALEVVPRRKWSLAWRAWAAAWLCGDDRTAEAARAVERVTARAAQRGLRGARAADAAVRAAVGYVGCDAWVAEAAARAAVSHARDAAGLGAEVGTSAPAGEVVTKVWLWTRADNTTFATLWGEGVEHTVQWYGALYEGVIHAYQDPWLASMFGPTRGYGSHTDILWEAEARGRMIVAPDCVGCETVRTIRRVEPPVITREQRVAVAVTAAMAAAPRRRKWATRWREWAERWLSGEDRSCESARATADAIHYAARRGFVGTGAAYDAVYAAHAAANTVVYAAANAVYAAVVDHGIDPVGIVHRVCAGEAVP